MTQRTFPDNQLARVIGHNVRQLRELHGITLVALADRVGTYGWKADYVQISKLERGMRQVTVEQLAAIGQALQVAPWSLTEPPPCEACRGMPPTGFTCNRCGTAAPSGGTA